MSDVLRPLTQFCVYLRGAKFRKDAHKVAALTMRRLAIQGFRDERDPYGLKWKQNLRGGNILRDRGRLIASLQQVPQAYEDRAVIGTRVPYAAVHQKGMVIRSRGRKAMRFQVNGVAVFARKVVIPRRRFLPDQDSKLPDVWNSEIGADLAAAMKQWSMRP